MTNPDETRVDIWLARESQWRDPALRGSLERLLTDDDRARVARMRFPEGRQEQLMARTLSRQVLSLYVPAVAPAEWRFETNAYGKPAVAAGMPAAARAVHFNLAHTHGLVVMAVASVPDIGVDVERTDKRAPLEVAHRYFSTAEIAALDALPPVEQAGRFQRLWTLKEAYLKAIGTGVSGGLGSMTFHFEDRGVRFEREGDETAARWMFREFPVDGEYLLALAVSPSRPGPLAVRLRDYLPGASGQEQGA